MFQQIIAVATTITGVAITYTINKFYKKKKPTCAYEEIAITEYEYGYTNLWEDI